MLKPKFESGTSRTMGAVTSAAVGPARGRVLKASPVAGPFFATQSPFLYAVQHIDYYPSGKPDMSVNAPLHNHKIGESAFEG